MKTHGYDRRTFLKHAGVGALGAMSLPAILGTPLVLAGESNGHRVYDLVAFSQAPATASGVLPRLGMRGCGTFKPDAGYVKGGGTYVLIDQASTTPKTIIHQGEWRPTELLDYDTLGLSPYANIQPSILKLRADFEGFASGVDLWLICNVGAAGAAGSTGLPEGFRLVATSLGTFEPIITSGIPLGLTHISLEGVSVQRGA